MMWVTVEKAYSAAAQYQEQRKSLSRERQWTHFTEPDCRHRGDGHVKRVPRAPSFDHNVAERAAHQHRDQQNDRQARTPKRRCETAKAGVGAVGQSSHSTRAASRCRE